MTEAEFGRICMQIWNVRLEAMLRHECYIESILRPYKRSLTLSYDFSEACWRISVPSSLPVVRYQLPAFLAVHDLLLPGPFVKIEVELSSRKYKPMLHSTTLALDAKFYRRSRGGQQEVDDRPSQARLQGDRRQALRLRGCLAHGAAGLHEPARQCRDCAQRFGLVLFYATRFRELTLPRSTYPTPSTRS